MLSLKLLRSLVLGETINDPLLLNQHHGDNDQQRRRRRRKSVPFLIFLPTQEIIHDMQRLATIARDMGMDLTPDPSISNILFSWPSSPFLLASLPFPSLSSATASHLRRFIRLSKGLFKLVSGNPAATGRFPFRLSSLSLFARLTGDRIHAIDAFSRILLGNGWSLFMTNGKSYPVLGGADLVYLFRKVDSNRVRIQWLKGEDGSFSSSTGGNFRVRELRLPPLNFRNVPVRILHYIILMTDALFYLA
ncbi:topoisomerase I damage affected-like protein [Tasmannia lanceolata]|uniref:topoisomerase I damage affected-like protein n=1 Tax=Tasmannia lanceolata TaxID=3420 RepID=UPI0040628891